MGRQLEDLDIVFALMGAARLGVSRRGFAEAAGITDAQLIEMESRLGVRLQAAPPRTRRRRRR